MSIDSVSEVLRGASYAIFATKDLDLIAESSRAVVGVKQFAQFEDLCAAFENLQARFVSDVFHRVPDEKQWDVYLVLLVPSIPEDEESTRRLESVINDTSYCRKIVVGTDRITSHRAWERALLPLLPISAIRSSVELDVIGSLADRLRKKQVAPEIINLIGKPMDVVRGTLLNLLHTRVGESHAD